MRFRTTDKDLAVLVSAPLQLRISTAEKQVNTDFTTAFHIHPTSAYKDPFVYAK
jgi:hypothetical protein